MKYIERVPTVKTTANENTLSDVGWARLDKIIAEEFPTRAGDVGAFISKKELEFLAYNNR